MEKKIWSKPEVSLVQFAANDYISTCLAVYSGSLYCALPGDPNYVESWTWDQSDVFQEPDGWLGTHNSANHGRCADASYFTFDGNHSTGHESHTQAEVWNVQIGEEVSDSSVNLGYQWPGLSIGDLTEYFSDSTVGKWFKAIWQSGDTVNGGTWTHYGLAYITDVITEGNPNRS